MTITLRTQLAAAKRAGLVAKCQSGTVYRCYLYREGVNPESVDGRAKWVGYGDSFISLEQAVHKALRMAFERQAA